MSFAHPSTHPSSAPSGAEHTRILVSQGDGTKKNVLLFLTLPPYAFSLSLFFIIRLFLHGSVSGDLDLLEHALSH